MNADVKDEAFQTSIALLKWGFITKITPTVWVEGMQKDCLTLSIIQWATLTFDLAFQRIAERNLKAEC